MKIVSTTNMSRKHEERLQRTFPDDTFIFTANMEEGRRFLSKADILVTFGSDVSSQLINEARRLRWIQVMSAGVDPLPFAQIKERDILVTNVRGIHAIPMAEYTFAVMLQITRRTLELNSAQRERRWAKGTRVQELWGKTLGIIGTGAIGKEIARRGRVFGMRTLGVNTDGRPVLYLDETYATANMAQVLAESDFVVITVPLLPSTRGLIGERELKTMKETAYLINLSRGPVVNEEAMIKVLQEKRIAGAVLDVFDQEPLPVNHPYWGLDNVIITPHISGLSPMYMQRAVDVFVDNYKWYREGKMDRMVNVVDLERQY